MILLLLKIEDIIEVLSKNLSNDENMIGAPPPVKSQMTFVALLCATRCESITKVKRFNKIAFKNNEFEAVRRNEQNLKLLTFN